VYVPSLIWFGISILATMFVDPIYGLVSFFLPISYYYTFTMYKLYKIKNKKDEVES